MIKAPQLFDPYALKDIKPKPQGLPSRQQLQRLRNGDTVQLQSHGEYFQCIIIYRLGADVIGRITGSIKRTVVHKLKEGDLISFITTNIYNVIPGTHHNEPASDWMVCSWPETTRDVYLLRTKYPSLLAFLHFNDKKASIKEVRRYDEPENYETDIPKILDGGRRWFIENYLDRK